MTAVLPHVAALYIGDVPWYPALPITHTGPAHLLWLTKPELLNPGAMRWADDNEVPDKHLTLDVTAIAELLYVAPIDPADRLDDDRLAAAVLAEADRCGCDLNGPICAIAQDAGDHPDACQARMRWCRQQATRLLGTEA